MAQKNDRFFVNAEATSSSLIVKLEQEDSIDIEDKTRFVKVNSFNIFRFNAKYFRLYPRHLKMRVGGKRVKPLSIEVLCDWAESAQPTSLHFQRQGV